MEIILPLASGTVGLIVSIVVGLLVLPVTARLNELSAAKWGAAVCKSRGSIQIGERPRRLSWIFPSLGWAATWRCRVAGTLWTLLAAVCVLLLDFGRDGFTGQGWTSVGSRQSIVRGTGRGLLPLAVASDMVERCSSVEQSSVVFQAGWLSVSPDGATVMCASNTTQPVPANEVRFSYEVNQDWKKRPKGRLICEEGKKDGLVVRACGLLLEGGGTLAAGGQLNSAGKPIATTFDLASGLTSSEARRVLSAMANGASSLLVAVVAGTFQETSLGWVAANDVLKTKVNVIGVAGGIGLIVLVLVSGLLYLVVSKMSQEARRIGIYPLADVVDVLSLAFGEAAHDGKCGEVYRGGFLVGTMRTADPEVGHYGMVTDAEQVATDYTKLGATDRYLTSGSSRGAVHAHGT